MSFVSNCMMFRFQSANLDSFSWLCFADSFHLTRATNWIWNTQLHLTYSTDCTVQSIFCKGRSVAEPDFQAVLVVAYWYSVPTYSTVFLWQSNIILRKLEWRHISSNEGILYVQYTVTAYFTMSAFWQVNLLCSCQNPPRFGNIHLYDICCIVPSLAAFSLLFLQSDTALYWFMDK